MIFIDKESPFYPTCIFKTLVGLSDHEQMEQLCEVPHQVLVDVLRELQKQSTLYTITPLPIQARIEMIQMVINNAYGNIFPPDEDWKTWWVLPRFL